MNLNKEERLEQIRNILIGSQIDTLEEKVVLLEKNITANGLNKQFEQRINDFEKLIHKELNSFKQLLGLEQAKQEKAGEQLQQLQTTSQDLSIKLNQLEKQAIIDEDLKEQFEKRINDFEKFVYEELGSLKQLFGFEQTKQKKANEQMLQLQTTSQDLSKKLSKLEKQAMADEGLKKTLEKRTNNLEKLVHDGQGSFKQILGLEQAKHEKANENLQRLQTTSQELSIKVSKLEKKFEQNQYSSKSSELGEVREQLELLQLTLNSQEIKNKNIYEQLPQILQEYTEQWDLKLSALEQKTLERDQVLQKYLLEYSKRSSNKLEELKKEMLENSEVQKHHFLAQIKVAIAEIKRLENVSLESKKNLELESTQYFSNELHNYSKISNRKSEKKNPLMVFWLHLWGWIRLNGRKRKENHF